MIRKGVIPIVEVLKSDTVSRFTLILFLSYSLRKRTIQ